MSNTVAQQFVLLPPRGIVAAGATRVALTRFFTGLENFRTTKASPRRLATISPKAKMRVVDSIHEDGAKLVEMTPEAMTALRAAQPGVRIVPVVYYYPAIVPRPKIEAKMKVAAAGLKISVQVVSAVDGKGVSGLDVVAFTNFASREGAQGTSNKDGVVNLALNGASKKIERLYVLAHHSYWSALVKAVTIKTGTKVKVEPIAFPFKDSVRHFYGEAGLAAGTGVTVGVIDTGVGPHKHLSGVTGVNTVEGESENDFEDNGDLHGTHVAGIIAARGGGGDGVRGIAPGVTLRSYRVFGKGSDGATNFAIAKAIDRAVQDGCDLINMSLAGGPQDEATHSAISDARAAGVLIFAATGNDNRSPVSFPAAESLALAVTAMGRKGTFPFGSSEFGDVAPPAGADKNDFIASFSNVGPEADICGPGVGVISTVPTDRWAVMDGTSMACPAVTGASARLLAKHPSILAMPRDAARSDAMAKAIFKAAKTLGFPSTMEGQGLILIT